MEFEIAKQKWRLISQALEGDGSFHDMSIITKHPRETDDKLASRRAMTFYENHIAKATNGFVGHIFKKPQLRDYGHVLLNLMIDDCDNCGNSMEVFFRRFAVDAKARGVMCLLVDMPKEIPSNLKEQKDKRAVPYLVSIKPEDIFDYQLDIFGKVEWATILISRIEKAPFDVDKIELTYRYFSKTEWRVYDSSKNVLEGGNHDLGVCPLLIFTESGNFPTVGEFEPIVNISKSIAETRSLIYDIFRNQTFSILAYHDPTKQLESLDIGTDNALVYTDNAPSFISPASNPADSLQKEVDRLGATIDHISYKITDSKSAESGISREYRFQDLNGALSWFAGALEDIEKRAIDIAVGLLRVPYSATIEWNRDFAIADRKSESEILATTLTLGMGKAYDTQKKKQFAKMDLQDLEEEDLQVVLDDIEQNNSEITNANND